MLTRFFGAGIKHSWVLRGKGFYKGIESCILSGIVFKSVHFETHFQTFAFSGPLKMAVV